MIAERVKNLIETNVHVVDERENKKQAFHVANGKREKWRENRDHVVILPFAMDFRAKSYTEENVAFIAWTQMKCNKLYLFLLIWLASDVPYTVKFSKSFWFKQLIILNNLFNRFGTS